MDIPSKDEDSDEENMALKGEAHDFHQSIMQEIHAETSPSKLQNDSGSSNDTIKKEKENKKGGMEEVKEADSDDEMFDAEDPVSDEDEAQNTNLVWRDMVKDPPDRNEVTSWGLKSMLGPSSLHEWNGNAFGDYQEELINRTTHEVAHSAPMPMEVRVWGSVIEAASSRSAVILLLADGRILAYGKNVSRPPKVERMIAIKERVLHISAGFQHFAAVVLTTEAPNLYTWYVNNISFRFISNSSNRRANIPLTTDNSPKGKKPVRPTRAWTHKRF